MKTITEESEIEAAYHDMQIRDAKELRNLQTAYEDTGNGQEHLAVTEELARNDIDYKSFQEHHREHCSGYLEASIVAICSDVRSDGKDGTYYYPGGVDAALNCRKCNSRLSSFRSGNDVSVSSELIF